jgi:hypothetical protein
MPESCVGSSRLAESPPAAQPKNAPAAVMRSPPSPAVPVGRAKAAAAHPDAAGGCPPPAGATPRAESEAATAAPTPTVVPKSSHGEGSASQASATSHGEDSAASQASATSHGQASAASHGEASATAMRRKAAGPCEAPTAVRPTAAHGRRTQRQASYGNRRRC